MSEIKKFNPLETHIQEIKKDCTNLVISDNKTYAGAKKARMRVQGTITDIESIRKEVKAPFLEKCRMIDATAKTLTDELTPIKADLIGKIHTWEDKKQKEREEKARLKEEWTQKKREELEKFRQDNNPSGKETIQEVEAIINRLERVKFYKKHYKEFYDTFVREKEYFLAECSLEIARIQKLEADRIIRMFERHEEITGEKFMGTPEELEKKLPGLEEALKQRVAQEKKDMESNEELGHIMKNPVIKPEASVKVSDSPARPAGDKKESKESEDSPFGNDLPVMNAHLDSVLSVIKVSDSRFQTKEALEILREVELRIFTIVSETKKLINQK